MFRIIILISLAFIASISYAQELMIIGQEKVSVDEFLRIYQKNNQSTTSYSEKDVQEYVELFTLFKMKLQEAKRMRLDTLPMLKEDYQKYTDQLVQNHFVDKNYIDNIWKAQYEHMKYDVKVAHIMVKCAPNANPSDTLIAYNKLNYLRQQATKDNFAKLATENSEDQSSAIKGGLLGYITAFMTFPEFEQPCFQTPIGAISSIFRTQYGYHIIHVLDKRVARGKIKVAHIYLKKSEKPEVAEKQIQEAYKQIISKKITFENAVKKYTEDASTKENYGILNEFGVSEMVNDFEEQCFALKNPGELSKPFMTEYGWHLVRLIEKIPVKGYEDSKDYIKQRMVSDPRVNNLKGIAYSRILAKYKFTESPANLSPLMANMPDTFFMIKNWVLKPMKATESNTLFSFAGKSFSMKDFSNYVNTNYNTASSKSKKDAIDAMYAAYKEKVIWQMAKELLSAEDRSYSQLESEYMNGLLIFEIMDREVWKKALADTLGSMKMYEEVKSNYCFKDRFILEGIKTKKTEGLDTYIQSLTGLSAKVVFEKIKQSKDSNEFVYYERTIERGDYPEIDKAMDAKAISVQFKDEDKSSILAKVVKLLPPSIKPYSEIRGRIQNLYQNKLEKEWGASLRSKYPVKINNIELSKIIKKQ